MKYFLHAFGLLKQQAAAQAPPRSTCGTDHSPPAHLLCKISFDKSKAGENQDMTMKDNIRPSLLNYLPRFCHVSFTTELSAPTPHQPASITLPLNFQSPGFSLAKQEGFPLNTWRVAPSLLFKCLKFSLVGTPPKKCRHSPTCFPHPPKPHDAAPAEPGSRCATPGGGVGGEEMTPHFSCIWLNAALAHTCTASQMLIAPASRSGFVSATPSQAEDTSAATIRLPRH